MTTPVKYFNYAYLLSVVTEFVLTLLLLLPGVRGDQVSQSLHENLVALQTIKVLAVCLQLVGQVWQVDCSWLLLHQLVFCSLQVVLVLLQDPKVLPLQLCLLLQLCPMQKHLKHAS